MYDVCGAHIHQKSLWGPAVKPHRSREAQWAFLNRATPAPQG